MESLVLTARCIAITGATGFIGHHLLMSLAGEPGLKIRALVHRRIPDTDSLPGPVTWIRGNLEDATAIDGLLEGADTLVHLAHPAGWATSRHEACIRLIRNSVSGYGIKRVIYCSSAVVVGPAATSPVDESTAARPLSDYEKLKLHLETLWREGSTAPGQGFDLAILRPTAVFGPGGRNLMRLAHALWSGSAPVNYLRASISGSRRMNLVCIENVISALRFLISRRETCEGAAFIVSDDDAPENNFRDVEYLLRSVFGRHMYCLPPLPVPGCVLDVSLRMRGRPRSDRIYVGHRLFESGWRRPVGFTDGLFSFAKWFADNHRSA